MKAAHSEQFLQHLRAALKGERQYEDKLLRNMLNLALAHKLPEPVRDSVLLLTRFRYLPLPHSPMRVLLEEKTQCIYVEIDLRWLDALYRLGYEQFAHDVSIMVHHELAHVLLGHLHVPLEKASDPLMRLAQEIAVNDGWLQLSEKGILPNMAVPPVSIHRLPFSEQLFDYAKEHSFPSDWLQYDELVYQALRATQVDVLIGSLSELLERLHRQAVTVRLEGFPDETDITAQQHVIAIVYQGEAIVQPLDEYEPIGTVEQSRALQRVLESVREALLQSGQYQYDSARNRFHYSPEGYSPAERVITPVWYRVPWHQLHRLLGTRRVLGYDRHRGHLYPKEEAPLITRQPARKEVYVFYDSSGSVPDEVLSGFIGIARRSPFRVREHYFSTVVTDHPHTGGTDFSCIEQFLLEQETYPDIVIVLTDGYAEANFVPKYPDRWYWFVLGDSTVPRRIGGTVYEIDTIQ